MVRSEEDNYMADRTNYVCAVCGANKSEDQSWFLLGENCGEDKLRIFYWHDELGPHKDFRPACSPPHVQELVVRWMTRGTLDHAYAKFSKQTDGIAATSDSCVESPRQAKPERLVAEIAVHRESLARALDTNLLCLAAMLDELWEALNQHVSSKSCAPALSTENVFSLVREM
jgi:hypothetical protein